MNRPETILRTLDRHLLAPTRLVLYGRAALALGYPEPLPDFLTTMDVDAILPEVEMAGIDADDQFWDAVEMTNEELRDSGLYLTHLFTDAQVALRPEWLASISPVQLEGLGRLQPFRPATVDLVLSKMMRVDPLDREDILFLLKQDDWTRGELEAAVENVRLPQAPEIREAFARNAAWLKTVVSA